MHLIGEKVRHRVYGIGEVIEQLDGSIRVRFPSKETKFPFTKTTFSSFLTFVTPESQEQVLTFFLEQEAEAARAEQERMRAEEARRAEQERLVQEQQSAQQALKSSKPSHKAHVPFSRTPGKRETFFVFQGATFDRESRGGYIWAPIENQNGKRVFHWDNLLDIRPGDIIFHGCDASIKAISEATGECYECPQPEELRTEDMWDSDGRRVDCNYVPVTNPIKTALVRDDIIRLCQVKYSPFDRDGNGNLGYLYHLNRELAQIFLRNTVRQNPKLGDIDFVRELLEE